MKLGIIGEEMLATAIKLAGEHGAEVQAQKNRLIVDLRRRWPTICAGWSSWCPTRPPASCAGRMWCRVKLAR